MTTTIAAPKKNIMTAAEFLKLDRETLREKEGKHRQFQQCRSGVGAATAAAADQDARLPGRWGTQGGSLGDLRYDAKRRLG